MREVKGTVGLGGAAKAVTRTVKAESSAGPEHVSDQESKGECESVQHALAVAVCGGASGRTGATRDVSDWIDALKTCSVCN